MSISKRLRRGKPKAPRENDDDAPETAPSNANDDEEAGTGEAEVSQPVGSRPLTGDDRDRESDPASGPATLDGPELLVLVPEVTGVAKIEINRFTTFQINRFRTYDDAAAFVRTSVSPELLSSTHIFWAMHQGPPPGNDPAGGEALVLIRADADRELVHIVSFIDVDAATLFARYEVKRGLDLASLMIYWAAFSPLAEDLAAGIIASAGEEPATQEPGAPDEAGPEHSGVAFEEPEERAGFGSKLLWALPLVAVGLLFIGTVCFLGPNSGDSGDEGGSGPPAAVQSQEDAAAPTPSPTSATTPAPAPEAGAATAGDDPAPAPSVNTGTGSTGVSTPSQPTATPKPTPTPVPRLSHAGDLDGSVQEQGAKKVKLLVKIHVHDNNHRPVAGATVSGQWTGGVSGPASCVTSSDGACVVTSKPLDQGGSATFTIGGIAADGHSYDSSVNHDPDSDSNGTSITVES